MTAGSDTDFLEKVRTCVDIREVVSDYLPLKKSGSRYRGLCPFHSEKTPSFFVEPGKQFFYCFGCGTGGDAFKFLMLYEKVEFPEALRMLARRYGVPIPERTTSGVSRERREVLKANQAALSHFRSQFRSGGFGRPGREYLERRGISKEIIEAFELGFAPESWDRLKSGLLKAGFSETGLVSSGLVLRSEGSGRTYDRFRKRVIFPIRNLSGDCVGFGGRIVGEGEPKYLNSPETAVFRKGETLYGLHRTGEAIRAADQSVLVEGYLDFLSLYQAGIRNLVATLGTGVTRTHARLLGRFSRRVVVNFDPDSAGQAATRRSLDIFLDSGFDVRVLWLSGGKDPDRFVREEGVGAYQKLLNEAPPCIEYLAVEATRDFDLATTAGKVGALNRVLPYVARLESSVARSDQVKLLAEVFRIQDGIVLQELKRTLASGGTNLKSVSSEGSRESPSGPAVRLIRILIEDADARQALIPEVRDEEFQGSIVDGIWRAVRDLARSGSELNFPRLGSKLSDPQDQALLLEIASLPAPKASRREGEICLRRMREAGLARRLHQIQERLEKTDPGASVDELLRQKIDLRREIRALRSFPAP